MRWKPDLNLTTNARAFTALYVGALVTGPPIVIYGRGEFLERVSIFMWAGMPLLGALVAGLIAGRGHGTRTAVLAYVISRSASVAGSLFDAGVHSYVDRYVAMYILPTIIILSIIGLAGRLGESLSPRRWPAGEAQHGYRWRYVGLALLLLFVYTHTLGARLAVDLHGHHGNDIWKAFPAGVYTGLNHGGLDHSQYCNIYYADPTGLLLIGMYRAPKI
jgi:hypothetical protein